MQLPEYDEYERIEVDHDEAHVLDMMERAQADEHWGLEQEQALLRDIERRENTFYNYGFKKEQTR